MPTTKELDERMTVNIQSWKKKWLQEIASDERLSDSKLLLKIVDEWIEKRSSEEEQSYERNDDGRTDVVQ